MLLALWWAVAVSVDGAAIKRQTLRSSPEQAYWTSVKIGTADATVATQGSVSLSSATPWNGEQTLAFNAGTLSTSLSAPLGTGDWTIELYANLPTVTQIFDTACWRGLISVGQKNTAGSIGLFAPNNEERGVKGANNAVITIMNQVAPTIGGTTSVNDGKWHHIALCKKSGTTKLFVDGTQEASVDDSNNYDQTAVVIGKDPDCPATSFFEGSMHSIRIFAGSALYSSNFQLTSNVAEAPACTRQVTNVLETARTFSSQSNQADCMAGMLDSATGHSAGSADGTQWTQMDHGSVMRIAGVVTQGKVNADQWLKTYRVSVSADATTWSDVDGSNAFTGNTDRNTKVSNYFVAPVSAQYVRIYPLTWQGFISYRSASITCEATTTTTTVAAPTLAPGVTTTPWPELYTLNFREEQMGKTMQRLRGIFDAMKTQLTVAQTSVRDYDKSLETLRVNIDGTKVAVEKRAGVLRGLKASLSKESLEVKISPLRARLAAANTSRSAFSASFGASSEKGSMSDRITAFNKTLVDNKTEIKQLVAKANKLTASLHENVAALADDELKKQVREELGRGAKELAASLQSVMANLTAKDEDNDEDEEAE